MVLTVWMSALLSSRFISVTEILLLCVSVYFERRPYTWRGVLTQGGEAIRLVIFSSSWLVLLYGCLWDVGACCERPVLLGTLAGIAKQPIHVHELLRAAHGSCHKLMPWSDQVGEGMGAV